MSVETTRNRDLLIKISFIYFLNHILRILEIDEEIIDIKPTEYITLDKTDEIRIFDNMRDFAAMTKSNTLILFEFKKDALRKKDFKQTYDYYRHVYCKEKKNIKTIIITISKGGKLTSYNHFDVTFHPQIIKTKRINQQKSLKAIRNKFTNNIELTSLDCSLLITLPLFDLEESEEEIVGEMCQMIKDNRHCIPLDELDGVIMGMYLNIVEYIDETKQDKLKEMIDLSTTQKGVIATFKEECFKDGKKEIIQNLLSKYSLDEVARLLEMSKEEIISIVQK